MMAGPVEYRNPSKKLSAEESGKIESILQERKGQKGFLLPLMLDVQSVFTDNWLPANVLEWVGTEMDVHPSYLYGMASFYSMFSLYPRGSYIIRVCESPACHLLGAETIFDVLQNLLGISENQTSEDGLFTLEKSACLGVCEIAPVMEINEVVYGNLTKDKVKKVIEQYRKQEAPDFRSLPGTGGEIDKSLAIHKNCILLDKVGEIDPENLDQALERGAYEGLKKALNSIAPGDVVQEVKNSGLRGRGGAGFPTGLKWSFTHPLEVPEKFVVCNADEGEPGTCKDRYIMEGDPHLLLEGIAICGYAIGAGKGFIYVRGEYGLSMHRLQTAINQAYERGFLGKNIMGSGFDFDIEIRSGAGAYVCGEETALIESIEGLRGQPRIKPPFPGVKGLWQKPTVVNNVETLSNVPCIINKGAEWYKSLGTEDSAGVKIFQICGQIKHPQVIEAPMGLTLRELIEDYGGGMRDGIPFKMCQTGGASAGFLTADQLDTPMDYASLQKQGGGLGSGTMFVMNEKTCVVDMVRNILYFFQHESCGFCTPCRRGTRVLFDAIDRIAKGEGQEADLDMMLDLSQTMAATANCALAMSPSSFIKTTLEHFREEYLQHIRDKKCPLNVCTSS
jgi:NADH-quinone oxidoreductase subunit F